MPIWQVSKINADVMELDDRIEFSMAIASIWDRPNMRSSPGAERGHMEVEQ